MHNNLREIYIYFLVILLIMPTVMVYIGVKNLMNCPKEPLIPVYLFIGGLFGILKVAKTLWKQWHMRRSQTFSLDDTIMDTSVHGVGEFTNITGGSNFIDNLIKIFLFVWFGSGNYWIWRIWIPNFKQPPKHDSRNWCSKDVYTTAVVNLIACYLLGVGYAVTVSCAFLYSRIKNIDSTDDHETTCH